MSPNAALKSDVNRTHHKTSPAGSLCILLSTWGQYSLRLLLPFSLSLLPAGCSGWCGVGTEARACFSTFLLAGDQCEYSTGCAQEVPGIMALNLTINSNNPPLGELQLRSMGIIERTRVPGDSSAASKTKRSFHFSIYRSF